MHKRKKVLRKTIGMNIGSPKSILNHSPIIQNIIGHQLLLCKRKEKKSLHLKKRNQMLRKKNQRPKKVKKMRLHKKQT